MHVGERQVKAGDLFPIVEKDSLLFRAQQHSSRGQGKDGRQLAVGRLLRPDVAKGSAVECQKPLARRRHKQLGFIDTRGLADRKTPQRNRRQFEPGTILLQERSLRVVLEEARRPADIKVSLK